MSGPFIGNKNNQVDPFFNWLRAHVLLSLKKKSTTLNFLVVVRTPLQMKNLGERPENKA